MNFLLIAAILIVFGVVLVNLFSGKKQKDVKSEAKYQKETFSKEEAAQNKPQSSVPPKNKDLDRLKRIVEPTPAKSIQTKATPQQTRKTVNPNRRNTSTNNNNNDVLFVDNSLYDSPISNFDYDDDNRRGGGGASGGAGASRSFDFDPTPTRSYEPEPTPSRSYSYESPSRNYSDDAPNYGGGGGYSSSDNNSGGGGFD